MGELQEIERVLLGAIEEFNQHEGYLIKNDLSERCICAKFACYLAKSLKESRFRDYAVDVEYNRGGSGLDYCHKTLGNKKIVVDLIVHKRGYDREYGFDNLFCIEMKKKYKKPDLTSDKERLKILTQNSSGFCYRAGYMVLISQDQDLEKYELEIDERFYNEYYLGE